MAKCVRELRRGGAFGYAFTDLVQMDTILARLPENPEQEDQAYKRGVWRMGSRFVTVGLALRE